MGLKNAEIPHGDGGVSCRKCAAWIIIFSWVYNIILQVQKAPGTESSTPSSSNNISHSTPLPLSSSQPQHELSSGNTSGVPLGTGGQQPQEHLSLERNNVASNADSQPEPFTRGLNGDNEPHKTSSDGSIFPCANTQLAAWPVDIFASGRKDILQKTSEAFEKPEGHGFFSHFPQHSTSDPSINNTVECKDRFIKGWSATLDHSFASNSSRWQAEISLHCLLPENQCMCPGLTATLNSSSLPSISWVTDTSEHTSVTSASDQQQQREHYPAETLSAVLNSSFANSHYNSSPLTRNFQFSDDTFHQESGLLKYMGMLVPLGSNEVATCSKSSSFKYTALHVRNPSLDDIPSIKDYRLPTPKARDLNDNSVPEHVRKGVHYNEKDLVIFQPQVCIAVCVLLLFCIDRVFLL